MILPELKSRFRKALSGLTEETDEILELIQPATDAKFGDYQANFAMPLGKRLRRPPWEVAQEIVARLDVAEFCLPPEIAGPGFINLRIRDEWLAAQLAAAVTDERLGVPKVEKPRTFVIDYSAPNVAKPMHVGHIRSTVIGDSLYGTLQFLGHTTVSDNHLGDWGTQFGMILYGYKHFLDPEAYRQDPVHELARVYRLVRRLWDDQERKSQLQIKQERVQLQQKVVAELQQKDQLTTKGKQIAVERAKAQLGKAQAELDDIQSAIQQDDADADFRRIADEHAASIGEKVLDETAKLHAGDEENLRLWREFMPYCRDEIDRMYERLGVRFDYVYGESFYHDRCGPLVEDLLGRKIAETSEGAVCIFFEDHDVPMIVRKQDGAFLYATTDLATLRYRMETWHPDAILYVVDHRQSLHFEQLFATARRMGFGDVKLVHVSFGTVLGEDGRPFKTRSGETVGLEGLLDEAVRRARQIVDTNDDAKPDGPELSAEQRARVAESVGIGALKYADLSQNRTSDYVFSYDKMLAMNGNTATYMQYAYARVRSIFAKGGVIVEALRASGTPILLGTPAERALGLELLRFGEALDLVVEDYRPNQLTSYLFELANCYSTFFENCPVLRAETPELRESRLVLCDLTARTIRQGLALLGIDVVEKM